MSDSPNPSNSSADAAEAPAAPELQHGPVGAALTSSGLVLVPQTPDATGKEVLACAPGQLLDVARALQAQGFDLLVSLAGVDRKTHCEVVYHCYGTASHQWVAIRVTLGADEQCPSVTPVWEAANWHEREAYDLFGITFTGHPKLERILMPVDWIGHPMRKDYKVEDERLVWNER
jgi:NADH/F420H2 dehydrogenase subunit C